MASEEHGSHQPARSTDPQPEGTLAKGLTSEDILEILRMILAGASLREVLTSVARVVESHREGMLCSVWLLDQDHVHMRAIAAPTLPESYIAVLHGFAVGPRGGSCGAAVIQRKPVFVSDVLTDPILEQVRDIIAAHGIRACWSAPIISHQGEILGTFAFYFRSVRSPSPRDIHLIENATSIAGIAIERNKAEESLRRSEWSLLEAQRLGHCSGSWSLDVSSGIVTTSPEMLQLFDVKPSDHYSSPDFWFNRIHPEDRERVRNLFEKCVTENTNYRASYRIILPNGSIKHVDSVAHRVLNQSGELVEFVGTSMDVTEQAQARIELEKAFEEIKQRTEAARRSERELRDVVNTVPAHVWSTSPEGQVDFVNDRWLQSTGLALDQAVGRKWEAVLHPDDRTKVVADWHSALKKGRAMESEARVRRADGEYCWWFIRNVPLRDETGKLVRWYGTAIDIEDRKRAEQALRKSEERWRSVFENSAIGVALTDLNGRFLATNHVYQTMVGYTGEELLAVNFLDLTHEDYRETNLALISELLEGKRRQFQIEKKYRRKDGSLVWVSNNVSLVPGTERVPQFIMALSEDITQRKRAEEALQRSEGYLAEAQKLTHTGSWVWNVRTDTLLWSQEVFRIYDFHPETMAHRTWEFFDRVHPEDRPQLEQRKKRMQSARKEWADSEIYFRIVLPDGTIKHLHSIAHPVIESGDEVVGTVMDVTEQWKARVELEKAFEEIKQRTEALRRSEGYLAEAQKLTHIGSWAWNVRTGVLFWSREIFRIYDYEYQETGITWPKFLERVHPEDRPQIEQSARMEASGKEWLDSQNDFRIILPNGTIKHLHSVAHSVRDDSGEVTEVVGTVMDVTAQWKARAELENAFEEIKQRTAALQRSEGYLAEAQKLTHTGSWAVQVPRMENGQREAGEELPVLPRFGWNSSYWSKEMYQIFGFDPGPTPPSYLEIAQRLHPEDARYYTRVVEKAIRDRTNFEADYRLLLPNGAAKYIHVVGHPVVNAAGDVIELVGTAMDVTEQHEARAALETAFEEIKAEEIELRRMTDAIASHIYVLRPDGTPLYANQTVLDYVGLTLEDVQKEDHRARVFHPEDVERQREERHAALARGEPFELEQRALGKDGNYRWFLVRYNPLRDDQGYIIRWYATATDIEDRKQAEERMRDENVALREQIDQAFMFEEIVGSSPALQTVLSSIVKVAPTNSTVLITGETGTGKELIARAIHKHSQRSGQAFISVNCASIPSSLIASELFGHEKGAFTGAVQRRQGRFELAHSGTIFLDEVGELPAETQIALLRVLQERQFERVGSNRVLSTDVRIIAATNRDLTTAIAAGTFRADLFYRLNVFPIEVPPLRKRREDIPMLVEYFVKRYAEKAGKQIRKIDRNTLEQCQLYPWPGNIRELQNIVERSVILCSGDTFWIEKAWLARAQPPRQELAGPLPDTLQNQEKQIIEAALAESKGKIAGPKGAAAKLGIPRSTLDSKIKQLNIKKHKFMADR
jgi:PAS domain S-box-containing protein